MLILSVNGLPEMKLLLNAIIHPQKESIDRVAAIGKQ